MLTAHRDELEALGQGLQFIAMRGEHPPRVREPGIDQRPDLDGNGLGCRLGDVVLAGDGMAEEDLLLVFAIGDRPQRLRKPPPGDHHAG